MLCDCSNMAKRNRDIPIILPTALGRKGQRVGECCLLFRKLETLMKLTIEIQMDNAAFTEDLSEGEAHGSEVARILLDYARCVEPWIFVGGERKTLFDINGNRVGKAEVTED